MPEWISKKLKDLGAFRSNGADKLTQPGETPVRLVNYMDVYRCERISNNVDFQKVTASAREIERCDLKRGDVLFTPSSETPDDIGRASVVTEDLPGAVYSDHVVRFRLHDPTAYDTDFLAYFFNQSSARNHFSARATGITRYTLNRSDFNSLELLIFEGTIANFAQSIKENRSRKGVARFPFVEAYLDSSAQRGILKPMESEQRALDTAQFSQCER